MLESAFSRARLMLEALISGLQLQEGASLSMNRQLQKGAKLKVGLVVPTRRREKGPSRWTVVLGGAGGRTRRPTNTLIDFEPRLTTLPGMDLPRRNRLPHEVPPWVPESSFFFITWVYHPADRLPPRLGG